MCGPPPSPQAKLDAYEPGRKIDKSLRWTLAELLGESHDPLYALFPEAPGET